MAPKLAFPALNEHPSRSRDVVSIKRKSYGSSGDQSHCVPALLAFSVVDTLIERPHSLGRLPVGRGHRFSHPPGLSRAPLPSISSWCIDRRLPASADLFSTLR